MISTNLKAEALDKISEQVKSCKKCGLCKTATNAVPGDGNPDSKLIFIGEAPGFHEDQQGKPFVGRAGKLLEFMLSQIGLKRDQVWIGNIIKHRPPDNRDPLPEELNACKDYLTEQINIIDPKIIVTLGRFSMNYFLPEAKISIEHGKPTVLNNRLIFPLYHPAAALRNGQVKIELLKDFLKIPDLLKLDNNEILKDNGTVKDENKSEPEQFTLL